MNGFINKGSNKVYPFNSSKNIEHKGLKLFDYIETLKKNIINLFNIMQVSFNPLCSIFLLLLNG